MQYLGFRRKSKCILSIGNQTGEGWFLTAEMIEYIEHDIPNIVCVQPFACLPNHVVGKGVIKTIRSKFPEANIAPIDYDPGASEANQTNRIKLMMTVAKDNLKNKNNINKAIKKENYIIDEKNKISIILEILFFIILYLFPLKIFCLYIPHYINNQFDLYLKEKLFLFLFLSNSQLHAIHMLKVHDIELTMNQI